ncbi:chemotaxis protein methyltransferase CheR [Fontimonas thermophila]|uniref:Chemotaxis protein methyltransferase n=1 Tax=Fontimonas thermophila TaxID=1076937 RepID=A0A1I2IRC2_9GAMM|nr:CheR family methyltransferase [Fontimonas thermophila]SFF44188.1 chemotaxis protein methyltransferase CheR [Fontimonas thermophila]
MGEMVIEREFAYDERDFERVRALILQRAGIALAAGKRDLVYSRLSRRLRVTGHRAFRDYLDALERTPQSPEWEAFTNALTTNLTAFFRESHHFDTLREHLRTMARGQRIALWSCAASTGEEPYTMAMTAIEALGPAASSVSILATDIDTQVLMTAERGVYPLERIANLAPERVKRFFLRGIGVHAGQCRVHESLRRMVTFRQLNLLDPRWPLRGPFAAIFCRNVMIYFDKPTQVRLMRRLVPLLAPGGLLFTGHSESLLHVEDLLVPIGRTTYRRPTQAVEAEQPI